MTGVHRGLQTEWAKTRLGNGCSIAPARRTHTFWLIRLALRSAMADTPNPYEPIPRMSDARIEPVGRSIPATWMVFYLITFVLLLITMPATSHSNNWAGILPAFGILMFGAYRIARARASTSTVFIYGCGTSILFLFRFLTMGRFRLWLEFQAPSTNGLVVMWIAICLVLGGTAAVIAHIVHENTDRTAESSNDSI